MQTQKKFVAVVAVVLFSLAQLFAESQDSIRVYWLAPVKVTGERMNVGQVKIGLEREQITKAISVDGFSFIRKGVFFAQDLYADGLKKGDINVVIDGERYPNACPNRMDSPVTRVNPLEITTVDLSKTSVSPQSGFGGIAMFHRQKPQEGMGMKAGVNQSFGAFTGTDAAALLQGFNHRVSLRYAKGTTYENGEGKTFKELYGYTEEKDYTLAEASVIGLRGDIEYGISASITRDILFPYLKMDERTNDLYSAYISYKGNKVYVNHTSHIMDNEFREGPMYMNTDAKNLTIGVTGEFYEAFYRNWDSQNYFQMRSTGMVSIRNHLIPDLNQYSASVSHHLDFDKFMVSGKLGLINTGIDDAARLDFYKAIHPDAEDSRTFLKAALGASYHTLLSDNISAAVMLEAAEEAPDAEFLYISVQKPAAKPQWAGNPTLDQPFRTTFRAEGIFGKLGVEFYASKIWNYVYLDKAAANNLNYLTYTNIEAFLTGINVKGSWELLDIDASYTYGENTTDNRPMAEIQPLHLSAKFKTPGAWPFDGFLRAVWENEQTRVDDYLNEMTTPSWFSLDLGLGYNLDKFRISLNVDNLTNENYTRHLSYLRDPFASGFHVYDPGRIFRINLTYLGLD
jgi:iron complex outermembrane receptor protein